MRDVELLDRLAALCGILGEYQDIWGRPHRAPQSTQRALLAAMGCRTGSAEEIEGEIAEREARPWRRVLPPVLVVRGSAGEVRVPLVIAERLVAERHVALLEAEDGGSTERDVVPGHADTGERRVVDGESRARCALTLRAPPEGYHRLRVIGPDGVASDPLRLVVAPSRCYLPAEFERDARAWGPAVQLYALRSARNWGIGDFTDLAALGCTSAGAGAGFVGVQPLHALFPHNPAHASPYSPSSRAFFNPLYLDIEAVPELAECEEVRHRVQSPELRARLAALRRGELVDYEAVSSLKHEILDTLYAHFRRQHLATDTDRARAFRAFQSERGELLASFGTFEAFSDEARRTDPDAGTWPAWPEGWRRPGSPDVARFAAEHPERVERAVWLEWLCEEQLGGVSRRCLDAGLTIGLYADLAVSVDRAGFEAWRHQDTLALDVGMGAPPDEFNRLGQNWGLPPFVPERLSEAGYAPWVECLRATMRHAGALRIDHVMGLRRSFWVPPGRPASEGAYVLYPFADLLGVLALESVRARCLVVGEDLGTVPAEVGEALGPAGVLSYRLFLFMKSEDGAFLPPRDYPRQAVVAASTHDLPTLAGWWRGHDIDVRARLGLFSEDQRREDLLGARSDDRARALVALGQEGLLPPGAAADAAALPEMTPELSEAIHRYVARSPSMLSTVQLEDVLGQTDQVNLPGTTDEHPNWRRKLATDLETIDREGRLARLGQALSREGRGRNPREA